MRVTALARQRSPVPWRTVGLLAALLLLLALAAAVFVGGQRHVPAPFGAALNGSIALVARPAPPADPPTAWVEPYGDIVAADPATGETTVLVGGPELDGQPVYSRDGTRLAYVRQLESGVALFAADASGGRPVRLTPQPMTSIREVAWSPDGRSVAFSSARGDESDLWIAATDGSGARQLQIGMSGISPAWRPPDGRELLFVGSTSPGLGPLGGYHGLWSGLEEPPSATLTGLYRVQPDGGGLTPVTPSDGTRYDYSHAGWTPDGERIVTQHATADPSQLLRVRVLTVDGEIDDVIEPDGGTSAETMAPVISPDGRRLAYVVISDPNWRVHVRPLDGSGTDLTLPHEFVGGAASLVWSPDGRSLIVNHHYFPGTWLLDPDGGPTRQATFTDPGFSEWQRLAP